jgi:hypothetical protein
MAYNLSQFITQAQGGGAVSITKATGNNKVLITIDKRVIELVDMQMVTTLTNGVRTEAPVYGGTLDLGTLFTAEQVLESASLKQAITDGVVTAVAGTVALSKLPTSAS